MSTWVCRLCLTLPAGEGLQHHIEAHARTSPYPLMEVREAIHELRATASHCETCRANIIAGLPEPWPVTDLRPFFEQLSKAVSEFVHNFPFKLGPHKADPLVQELDARERALDARKNRNTGPARPTGQAARRPRRHK